jgi:hypothetical protein
MLFINPNRNSAVFANNLLYNLESFVVFFVDPLLFLCSALRTLYWHNNKDFYLMCTKVFLSLLNKTTNLISFILY